MHDPALDTLVAGFVDDPLYRWLYPDPKVRRQAVRDTMRLTLELSREIGHVQVAPDGAGVALWTPAGVDLLPNPEPFITLLERWAPDRVAAALDGMAACAAHAVAHASTLQVIAVRPAARGRGLGAQLLRPWLDQLDHERTAGYLESSNLRNVPFYERLGFRARAKVPVADGGPTMRPMARRPRSAPPCSA